MTTYNANTLGISPRRHVISKQEEDAPHKIYAVHLVLDSPQPFISSFYSLIGPIGGPSDLCGLHWPPPLGAYWGGGSSLPS